MDGWVPGWDAQHSVQHGGGWLKEFRFTPDEITSRLPWLVKEQEAAGRKPEMVLTALATK